MAVNTNSISRCNSSVKILGNKTNTAIFSLQQPHLKHTVVIVTEPAKKRE